MSLAKISVEQEVNREVVGRDDAGKIKQIAMNLAKDKAEQDEAKKTVEGPMQTDGDVQDSQATLPPTPPMPTAKSSGQGQPGQQQEGSQAMEVEEEESQAKKSRSSGHAVEVEEKPGD